MKNTVYQIDSNGKTSEIVIHALNEIDAIKAVYIHKLKKYMNKFKYKNIKLNITETSNGYYFKYNHAQLFVLKQNTNEKESRKDEYKIS